MLGGSLIGVGFGLGIAGMIVSPDAGERAKADQAEYVFVPPEDRASDVNTMVDKHNRAARERCKASPVK